MKHDTGLMDVDNLVTWGQMSFKFCSSVLCGMVHSPDAGGEGFMFVILVL